MKPIVFFDPLHTGGPLLHAAFDRAFGNRHVRCYPPEPVSRGRQVERAAAHIWLNGFQALSLNYHAPPKTQPGGPDATRWVLVDHPFDRLYEGFIASLNLYMRFEDYQSGRMTVPMSRSSFPNFASMTGKDNGLVRFLAEMENETPVTDAHADIARRVLDSMHLVLTPGRIRAEDLPAESEPEKTLAEARASRVAERAQLAEILLARTQDQDVSRYPAEPAPRGTVPESTLPFSETMLGWLDARNRFDLALYEHALTQGSRR